MKNGILLDKEVLGLFSETEDIESVKFIIESVRTYTNQKILTKNFFRENKDKVGEFFLKLPEESQKKFNNLKIKLGLTIEISKEDSKDFVYENEDRIILSKKEIKKNPELNEIKKRRVKILSNDIPIPKKLEVKDFVFHFRERFSKMRNILQEHSGLKNLTSINKISGTRSGFSLIGIVYSKVLTHNKNLLLEIEDLTGKIKVLISKDKKELFKKAEDIPLDSVIGFSGSGNREIFFVNEFFLPNSILPERKKSLNDEGVLFLGDLHIGSKLFMEENFLKFIDYLNGKLPNTPESSKIKYLFIVGDLISGIGNYPNQQRDLKISELEEQFIRAAELLGKIRKDINIIISPGNHDCVRLMEPQPCLDKKYAWPLYELENVFITNNPSLVNISAKKDFNGFNIMLYHGVSYHYFCNEISSLIKQKAVHAPEIVMKYLLQYRHLAPSHGSMQYFPFEKDSHFIEKIPDILVSGHLHKSGISYHNNILVISTSTWEGFTDYMEKVGSKPDFCKVPMFNLKTRKVKILDFE
jgi:DNA polymerase II small subunit